MKKELHLLLEKAPALVKKGKTRKEIKEILGLSQSKETIDQFLYRHRIVGQKKKAKYTRKIDGVEYYLSELTQLQPILILKSDMEKVNKCAKKENLSQVAYLRKIIKEKIHASLG